MQAPNTATFVDIDFEKGNPVAIDGVKMSPATVLTALNKLGGDNAIGRLDLVESRFVGMKSRGERMHGPGGLRMAHVRMDRGGAVHGACVHGVGRLAWRMCAWRRPACMAHVCMA